MDKYVLNAFFSTGDERKEFNSLDAAINYARQLLDNSVGENFAGVDVEDENGEIIYSLFADGLEEKSGVAIHGEKVTSDTIIKDLPLKWYAYLHGTFMYHGEKYVILEMSECVSTTDGEIVSFLGKAVKIGEKVNSDMSINLYRIEWDGVNVSPMSVSGYSVIAL